MRKLCNYVGTSIHEPHARILCDRAVSIGDRCYKHNPTNMEADRLERLRANKIDKAEAAYTAACTELGRALMNGGFYIPALGSQVENAQKLRKKLRKLRGGK